MTNKSNSVTELKNPRYDGAIIQLNLSGCDLDPVGFLYQYESPGRGDFIGLAFSMIYAGAEPIISKKFVGYQISDFKFMDFDIKRFSVLRQKESASNNRGVRIYDRLKKEVNEGDIIQLVLQDYHLNPVGYFNNGFLRMVDLSGQVPPDLSLAARMLPQDIISSKRFCSLLIQGFKIIQRGSPKDSEFFYKDPFFYTEPSFSKDDLCLRLDN